MQSKSLYIAEKPSVAKEFAKVLNVGGRASDGYLESADAVVTWCVGHLVTMSYPEVYDPKLKKWSLDTLPFLPEEFKYELIDDVKKQFRIVERLLNREDVTCTDQIAGQTNNAWWIRWHMLGTKINGGCGLILRQKKKS